ncbi:MAG: hypothetical protein QOJ12_604, partial [Thermoleophilales bacterium]|nr:hypothetical protein [Thermoleophilales bacterium]
MADERNRDDTPAGGYPVPEEQQTQAGQGPGDQATRIGATPADRPTQVGQPTQEAAVPPPPPPPPPPGDDDPDDTRTEQQKHLDQTRVTNEQPPAPPTGGEDDEYRWHTDRTARSESAEKDAVEFIDVKKSFGRNTIL